MSFTIEELLPACAVLFGADAGLGVGFLERLHRDQVKKVFRRRALETHPDRAVGIDTATATQRFQEVNAAHELLQRFLTTRGPGRLWTPASSAPRAKAEPRPKPAAKQPPKQPPKASTHAKTEPPRREPPRREAPRADASRASQPASRDFLWRGQVPSRDLRLGEYLFYRGRISMKHLIAALTAQRLQRPVFGRCATEHGLLNVASLGQILAGRRAEERVGDAAVRLGHLTPAQRDLVLGYQLARQLRFGQYFVDIGLLADFEVDALDRARMVHNFSLTARRAG